MWGKLLKKRIMIIFCILIIFLTISTVSAEDLSLGDTVVGGSSSDLSLGDTVVGGSSSDLSLGDTVVGDSSEGIDDTIELDDADEIVRNQDENMFYQENIDSNVISDSIDLDESDISNNKKASSNLKSSDYRVQGTIYYVGPNGNDIAGRGTLKNPYKTIEKAMSVAVDGDGIYLLNGTYYPSNTVINKNLTFIGESQDNVILSGNYSSRIFKNNATDVGFINLTFINGYASGNDYNGGAITSTVGGNFALINCTFLNNKADTHGGAVNIMINSLTDSPEKRVSCNLIVDSCTFINNTALSMYGGAIHATCNIFRNETYTPTMTADIESSIFINNTGGREQEHSISIAAWESTYFEMHNCVIFADPETIISSEGAYKALVYYRQHSSRGEGYANVDYNWWGDNFNPADFNRTSNIEVNNWIVMNATVSKNFVVATLDTVQYVNNTYESFDSSLLPSRLAIYSPESSFGNSEVELVGGIAKNRFIGSYPQEVIVTVDYQNLTVLVEDMVDYYWYIGNTGYMTLQDAVNAAVAGDVIKGVPDIYTPDELESEIIIDKDLTITKLDNVTGDYILLSSDSYRIFNVAEGVNLNLSNLIFEGGSSSSGGLIYINSGASVNINNSIFRKADASDDGSDGGAIYSKGDLYINNTVFDNIKSNDIGGAIYLENGILSVDNSKFNRISSDYAGAIFVNDSSSLIINNSQFIDTSANSVGAIYSNASSTIISNSKLENVEASESYRDIFVENSLIMNYCLIINENPDYDGVEVFVSNVEDSNLDYNYWGVNSKPNSSKTNVDVKDWVILNIFIDEDLALIAVNSIHNVTLDFNHYTDGVNNYTLENAMPELGLKLTVLRGYLNQTSIIFNQTNNQYTIRYVAPAQVGPELIDIVAFSDQNLSFNVRTPVIYYWFVNEIGYETLQEAIDGANDGDTILGIRFNHLYDSTVIVNKSLTIKSNDTVARATFNGRLLANGPILYVEEGVNLVIDSLSFINAFGNDYGTAILNNGNLEIKDCSFNANNNNNAYGGVIFNNATLKIIDSAFTNSNGLYGGAIYNNGNLALENNEFANNSATYGGAIYNNGSLNSADDKFINNSANLGGAIYNAEDLILEKGIFVNDSASTGGAVYSFNEDNQDSLRINYTIFDSNEGNIGSGIAANNMVLENNFFATSDYSNLVYNLSSSSDCSIDNNFELSISGPESIGFAEIVEFTIELINENGAAASNLPNYNLTISNRLSNLLSLNKFNVKNSKLTLAYSPIYEIGEDCINVTGLKQTVGLFEFVINPLNTHIDVENVTMYYNDGSSLIIYLKDSNDNVLVGRDLLINISGNEKTYTTDSEGKVKIDIDYEVDHYEGSVSFAGESNYLPSNANFSIDVQLIPTTLIAEDIVMYYNNGTALTVFLNDVYGKGIFDKEIIVSIGTETYSDFTDGQGRINIDLHQVPNNYTCSITFAGDEIYEDALKSINLEVKLMPTIINSDDITIYFNETATIVAYLTDLYDTPLVAYELSIKTIGLDYSNFTDSEGKVVKEITAEIGNYSILIDYAGNDLYESCQKTVSFNVIRMPTVISVNTIVYVYDEENNVTAYLTDIYDNPLKDKTIILKVDSDQIYELITDFKGEISQLLNLDVGNHDLTFTFNGDDEYDDYNVTVNVNVIGPTKTVIESEDILSDENNVSINASFKDNETNPIVGEFITLSLYKTEGGNKVFIKNYTKISDSLGQVKLDIDLESGNYEVLISFAGSDEYARANKTIKVIVIDGKIINVSHTGNDALDIQRAIDSASPGDLINLGDYDYENVSSINITKDLTLYGDNTIISSANDGSPVFIIPPISEDGPKSVNITGIEFKLDNGDVAVLATADNSTNPLEIDTAEININGNGFSIGEDVVAESVTVLKLQSERGVLAPSNNISISGNTIDAGVNSFEFEVTGVNDGSNIDIPSGPIIPERIETQILYENMTTTAVDVDTDGRVGEYFYITLKDKNGNLLANKPVQIGFNGNVYDRTTDENGSARLQINLKNAGTYTFAVSYLGDGEYNGSFIVAKIVVSKQKATLTVPNKSYKASATSKTLTATFKSASGKVVKDKKITFAVNGKSYSATTNDKGVATVKVSLNAKGTYSFTAKFAGNNMYAAITKSAKLTIK